MAVLTPNHSLKKPNADGLEGADLRVFVGENMDLIDSALATKVTKDGTGKVAQADLPTATASVKGGVKVGTGLAVTADGTLSATGGGGGGATMEAFSVYQNTAQAFSAGTFARVNFHVSTVAVGGSFDLTADEYVVPTSGVYSIGASLAINNSQLDGNRTVLAYYINGVSAGWIADSSTGKAGQSITHGSAVVNLTAGQKLSVWGYSVGANNTNIVSGNALTHFYGHRIG